MSGSNPPAEAPIPTMGKRAGVRFAVDFFARAKVRDAGLDLVSAAELGKTFLAETVLELGLARIKTEFDFLFIAVKARIPSIVIPNEFLNSKFQSKLRYSSFCSPN
jgi:hypothetical protein